MTRKTASTIRISLQDFGGRGASLGRRLHESVINAALVVAILLSASPVDADGALALEAGQRAPSAAHSEQAAPLEAIIGTYLSEVTAVNLKSQIFEADFYLWMRYPTPENREDVSAIEAIEFVNSSDASRTLQERKVIGDETYVVWRVHGPFHWDADYHLYPFDRQTLPIRIEHTMLEESSLVFVDDTASYSLTGGSPQRSGVSDVLRVPDFDFIALNRRVSVKEYATNFGDTSVPYRKSSYSRYEVDLVLQRVFVPYLLKILTPLTIILILSYLVFFIPAESLDVASALTVTSLLACIAFEWSVSGALPNIGYIVMSDRIFHLCYVLIMLAMAQTVYTFALERNGRLKLADRLETIGRFAFPAVFVAGVSLIAWTSLA